jgi:hypothetical protein
MVEGQPDDAFGQLLEPEQAADDATLWAKVKRAEGANWNSQEVKIPAIVLNSEQF